MLLSLLCMVLLLFGGVVGVVGVAVVVVAVVDVG